MPAAFVNLRVFESLRRHRAAIVQPRSQVVKDEDRGSEVPRFRGSEVRVLRRSRGGHFLLAAYAMAYIGVGSHTGDFIRTFEAVASSPELAGHIEHEMAH